MTFTNTIVHGRRAHTIGDIFPFRVMVQGKMDNLRYHVIKPDGKKLGEGQYSSESAFKVARMAHALWSS